MVTVVTLCQSGGGVSGGRIFPSILYTWPGSDGSGSESHLDMETVNIRHSTLTRTRHALMVLVVLCRKETLRIILIIDRYYHKDKT